MGILDQDVNDKVSLAVPQLYRRGIERKEWSQRKFWWVHMRSIQSIPANIVTGCTWVMVFISR